MKITAMTKELVFFFLRHLATTLFGALVVRNWISDDLAHQLTGSAVAYAGVLILTIVLPALSKTFAVMLQREAVRIATDSKTGTPEEHIHDVAWRSVIERLGKVFRPEKR